MTLHEIENSTEITAVEHRENYNLILQQIGLEAIRQTIGGSVVHSAAGDDAYVSGYSGQRSSAGDHSANVDYTEAEGVIDNDQTDVCHYFSGTGSSVLCYGLSDESTSDTWHEAGTWSNTTNTHDGSETTYADTASADWAVGRTFATKTVDTVRVKALVVSEESAGSTPLKAYIQTYNGAAWSNHTTLYDDDLAGDPEVTLDLDVAVYVNSSCDGVRLLVDTDVSGSPSQNSRVYVFEYGDPDDGTIVQTIDSGRFESTVSSGFCTVLYDQWESGVAIQWKLINASEDTGWLEINEITEFTAFTAEPTELHLKVSPKGASPTSGKPCIRGVWCVAR